MIAKKKHCFLSFINTKSPMYPSAKNKMKITHSRFSLLRFSMVLFKCLSFLMVVFLAVFYIRSFRNFVLRPVWPKVWQQLSSHEVIIMTRSQYDSTVTNLESCPFKVSSNVSLQDVKLTSATQLETAKVPLRDESHRSFLPVVDDQVKLEILHLYRVMVEALERNGIKHFFVDGSLLGVARHGGFVPWDDDLDISINVTEWPRVRSVLSCIQGYKLDTSFKMHWKFYRASDHFPFIDIFFYTENDKYLWAIPYYITQTVVYPLKDVFPLTVAQFESLQVPVPRHFEDIIRRVFDLDVCQSPSSSHLTGKRMEVVTIPCSSLGYLYHMKT